MTQNQIAYWNLQETKRSNLVNERLKSESQAETARSNRVNETEINRSNVARETETNRSNVAKEAETNRANLVKEQETARHNAETESQGRQKLATDAAIAVVNSGTKLLTGLIDAVIPG